MRRLVVLGLAVALFGACASDADPAPTRVVARQPSVTDVTQPIEQLQMKASRVADLLAAHKWHDVVAAFSPTMRAGMTARSLRTAWLQVEAEMGGYKSRGTTTRIRPDSDLVVFETPMNFARHVATTRVGYDVAGRIAGLRIIPAVS